MLLPAKRVVHTFLTGLEGKHNMNNNTNDMKTGSLEPAVLQSIYKLENIYSLLSNTLLSILNIYVSTLDNIDNTVFGIVAGAAVV